MRVLLAYMCLIVGLAVVAMVVVSVAQDKDSVPLLYSARIEAERPMPVSQPPVPQEIYDQLDYCRETTNYLLSVMGIIVQTDRWGNRVNLPTPPPGYPVWKPGATYKWKKEGWK